MSLNLTPESDLIPESDLRAALRPCKMADEDFEAGVFERIQAAETRRATEPLADAPPLLKVAASIFPVSILTGGKIEAAAVPVANGSILYKVIGFLAMPATLLVMLGAAVWSALKVRQVQQDNMPEQLDQETLQIEVYLWWHRHRVAAWFCFSVMIGLTWIGATSLMLLIYLFSMCVMVLLFAGFAKVGLANRNSVARSVIPALGLLGQISGFCSIGMDDIHFVDQQLLSAVFFAGALPLLPALSWSQKEGAQKKFLTICFGMLLVPATVLFFSKSIWWPVTNSQIKHHVESFDHARFSTSSWRSWEIVASWSIESGLNPDLSVPRKLFEKEISGQLDRTNGFIDGVASRTGLVPAERLLQLVDFDPQLQSLLRSLPQHQITSLNQHDWVIRTSAQLGQLSSDQKDLLEQRLLVTMNKEIVAEHAELEDVLRVTELLEIIGRPINLDQYRNQVHAFLREFHTKSGGGFQPAGGFRSYRTSRTGSLEPTAYAVELMQTYGVPDGLDLNWIRSYLRPLAFRPAPDNFVAAVALDRLNHLPGVKFPTWLDYLYYERSLVMAVLLVAICIYATLSSPTLRDESTADGLTST